MLINDVGAFGVEDKISKSSSKGLEKHDELSIQITDDNISNRITMMMSQMDISAFTQHLNLISQFFSTDQDLKHNHTQNSIQGNNVSIDDYFLSSPYRNLSNKERLQALRIQLDAFSKKYNLGTLLSPIQMANENRSIEESMFTDAIDLLILLRFQSKQQIELMTIEEKIFLADVSLLVIKSIKNNRFPESSKINEDKLNLIYDFNEDKIISHISKILGLTGNKWELPGEGFPPYMLKQFDNQVDSLVRAILSSEDFKDIFDPNFSLKGKSKDEIINYAQKIFDCIRPCFNGLTLLNGVVECDPEIHIREGGSNDLELGSFGTEECAITLNNNLIELLRKGAYHPNYLFQTLCHEAAHASQFLNILRLETFIPCEKSYEEGIQGIISDNLGNDFPIEKCLTIAEIHNTKFFDDYLSHLLGCFGKECRFLISENSNPPLFREGVITIGKNYSSDILTLTKHIKGLILSEISKDNNPTFILPGMADYDLTKLLMHSFNFEDDQPDEENLLTFLFDNTNNTKKIASRATDYFRDYAEKHAHYIGDQVHIKLLEKQREHGGKTFYLYSPSIMNSPQNPKSDLYRYNGGMSLEEVKGRYQYFYTTLEGNDSSKITLPVKEDGTFYSNYREDENGNLICQDQETIYFLGKAPDQFKQIAPYFK